MRNSYIALESGWIPGHPNAFQKNAVGKVQYYDIVGDIVDAVVDVAEDVVDFAGDVIDVAVDVVEDVAQAAGDVIQTAIDDPIRTIATIAAIAAGQPELIPYINAADTLADGGSFDDALKSAAISYAAQGTGSYVGGELGTALEYGTDPLSSQTSMLASQTGDMLGGTTSGTLGAAAGAATAGATAAALSGGDIDQAIMNALGSYFTRTGVNYTINSLGQLVDQYGNLAPDSVYDEIGNMARDEYESLSALVDQQQAQDPFYQAPTYDDTTDLTNLFLDTSEKDLGTLVEEQQAQDTNYQEPTYDATTDLTSTFTEPTLSDLVEEQQAQDPNYQEPTYSEADLNATFGGTEPTLSDLVEEQQAQDPNYQEPTYSEADLTPTFTEPVDVWGAAKSYLQNQFTNQLTRQLLGGSGPTRTAIPSKYLSSKAYTPYDIFGGENALSALGLGDLFSSPETEDIPEVASTRRAQLWDPNIGLEWSPRAKLGGLGFAGKFINDETNERVLNAEEEERQKLMEEVKNRGWATEEERQILEQGSPYYEVNPEQPGPLNLGYAKGGVVDHNPEFYSEGGASIAHRYVKGDGDGTSDSVPAMLASGEFVIPADVVSGLGNGDNDAGAKVLDEFMKSVRQHKRAAKPEQLPPDSKGPLSYLADAKKKVGKKHGRT